MSNQLTLIAFASYWGSQKGGINAFNADFLQAMAMAYYGKINIICIVLNADEKTITDAKNKNITLIPLPYAPSTHYFGLEHVQPAIEAIHEQKIAFDPEHTIWLGHDLISGQAALGAAEKAGGRSALIHHMSYDHYEAFAENAQTAHQKTTKQKALFGKGEHHADIIMAVGPVLRDALQDIADRDDIHMIIPGLADIQPKSKTPNAFTLFVSGRFSRDALKVKQGQLSVAAFAASYQQAQQHNQPAALLKRPKLLLRGVNFESIDPEDTHYTASEENLHKFAQNYADAVINLHPLPYTTDREQLGPVTE